MKSLTNHFLPTTANSSQQPLLARQNLRRTIALACAGGCLLSFSPAYAAEYTTTITGTESDYAGIRQANEIIAGTTYDFAYHFGENDTIKATDYGINIRGQKIWLNPTSISASGGAIQTFAINADNSQITLQDVSLTATATGERGAAYAISAKNGSTVSTGTGTISAISEQGSVAAIYASSNSTVTSQATAISATGGLGQTYAVSAQYNSTITLQDTTITATATGENGPAIAIHAYKDSTVSTGAGTISAITKQEDVAAYAISASNGSAISTGTGTISAIAEQGNAIAIDANDSTVTTKADKILANGAKKSLALSAVKGGTVTADNAQQVAGDLAADSGTINLTITKGGTLNGIADLKNNTAGIDGKINLTLGEDAVWTNKLVGELDDFTGSHLTSLKANQATISQADNNAITVDNFAGNATVSYAPVLNDGVLTGITGGAFVVKEAEQGSHLTLKATGVNTQDKATGLKGLEDLAGKLEYNGTAGNLSGSVRIEEGLLTPWAKAEIDLSNSIGKVDQSTYQYDTGSTTATMRGIQSAAAVSFMAWRAENNDLQKRLGELRLAQDQSGIWARVFSGESKYDEQMYYKNKYSTIQLGYDSPVGSNGWHIGGAISYTDGSSSFATGSGDNTSTALAVYGSWLGKDGQYIDLIAKQSRLNNQYTVFGATSDLRSDGDYDTYGTSLSAEYGRRIALKNGLYIEPQGELTWGRVGSESYTTKQGMQVYQDSTNSLIGRIGVAIGKKMDDGSIYFKTSLAHEFQGEVKASFTHEGISRQTAEDFGDTWLVFNLGGSKKLSKTSYGYADLETTAGGNIKTLWKVNAGVRWSF